MRKRSKVDLTDPAALAAWLTETRILAEHLHALTLDATSPKVHRRHSRTYLRAHTRRGFQTLAALLSTLDPADPAPAEKADRPGQPGGALTAATPLAGPVGAALDDSFT